MGRLINQGHAAKHVGKVGNAAVSGLEVTGLGADGLLGDVVDVVLVAVDQKRAIAGEEGGHKVHGNVFAVESVVDVLSDLDHGGFVGRVVLHEGDVSKGEVGENHGVDVLLVLVVVAKAVAPCSPLVGRGTTSEGSRHATPAKLAPCLVDKFEILGVVVDVVVGQEHSLGGEIGVGPQLLVEAVALRATEADRHAIVALVVGRGFRFEVVPDDDNFEERGDFFLEENVEGVVEFLWSLVGLHGDSGRQATVSIFFPILTLQA